MNTPAIPEAPQTRAWGGIPRLQYATVGAILFAFWSAMAVTVAVTFALTVREDRRADATPVAAVTAPAARFRPSGVPADARLVVEDLTLGPAPDDVQTFFHMGCDDGVLAVVTTRATLYAQTRCADAPPRASIDRFLGLPVQLRIGEGAVAVVAADERALRVDVGDVWLIER